MLVEMAFTLPILAMIFISIIDLGLIVRDYQVLQNAAREGARLSSMEDYRLWMTPGAEAEIKDVVRQYALQERITLDVGWISVSQTYPIPGGNGFAGGLGSEITVTYPRSLLLVGAPFLPSGSVTLKASAVFFNLY